MKKPIKIASGEEFILNDTIFTYSVKDGSIELKRVGKYEGKARKTKEFIAPTLDEVKAYFKEEGYTEESAIKFHKSYSSNNWKDSNDKQVKNWRQKAINVWFRPDNELPKQKTEQDNTEMAM